MGISLNPSTILSGQGIDVSSIVDQIINSQSGELNTWESQQTSIATQDGLLEGMENNLTNLQTAVAALADPVGALAAQAATSSDDTVLTAAAQTTAISGTHQIVVNNLATTGTLYTASDAAGADTSILTNGATSANIQLQVGGSSGSTYNIAITAGQNDTLTTLASYINSQSSANDWGVTASVVTDATGSRLALQSQASGSSGALSVASSTPANTSLTFETPEGGTNASLTIDGVPFSSASNTVTGAIAGVTLNLNSAAPDETVQLTVGADQNQITNAVNNFVSAYNTLVSSINTQYDVTTTGTTTTAPPLLGDPSLSGLQSSLLNDASYAVSVPGWPNSSGDSSETVNLASLGINQNNDGTLTVGSNAEGQTFAQVLAADPSAVQQFFQNASSTGFANNFNTDLTNLTNPTSGPLNVDLAQNEAENTDLSNTISSFEAQLNTESAALTSQYDSVNASLQAYPILLQEMTEVLGTLGSGTSSNGTPIASEPTLTAGL